jgi:hypothetical protein
VGPATQKALRAAEETVTRLVEACRKAGPLYPSHPGAVTQVSRTSKWLLHALSRLRRELSAPAPAPDEGSS